MKIVVTGAGSGGHITPVLAVAHELRQLRPDSQIIYIGQTGDSLADVPAADPSISQTYTVRAGKFRRYHGAGWRQLFDVPTIAKNVRDAVYVLIGILQCHRLLRRIKPDVVFIKGGFVGVPVGLAAAWLKIPFVTHDSDALPGLANRIIARWASLHAVALPKAVYSYPASKTVTVGVPISRRFHIYSAEEQRATKTQLGFDAKDRIILMTGGGLGARRLNQALASAVPELLRDYPTLHVVQLAGRNKADELHEQYQTVLTQADMARVHVKEFITDLYDYSAIAEVVVTRAGGTSMAEFAAQAKACLVVPNPELTGGHQTKNGKVLADAQAVELLTEPELAKDPRIFTQTLRQLLDDPARQKQLGEALHKIAQPDAAHRLAMVLLEQAQAG